MQVPAGFQAGVDVLDGWLEATKDPTKAPDPSVFAAIEDAAKQLSAECRAGREKTLEDIAQKRMPTATARNFLDTLAWADRALYHSWGVAQSLRDASSNAPVP